MFQFFKKYKMLLGRDHSQGECCEEQGCSTQVLLTPVPRAGAVSGQGRARHSLYVWLLLRLLLLKNLLASTLLRDTEQREGFCFLYSMLSLMASLITCRDPQQENSHLNHSEMHRGSPSSHQQLLLPLLALLHHWAKGWRSFSECIKHWF